MTNRILAVFFLFAISFPATAFFLRIGVAEHLDENRAIAPRPSFAVSRYTEFPKAFERYLDDHVPFRKQLIVFYQTLQLRLFKTDETSHLVLGKNGWMYYVSGDEMRDFLGEKPFSQDELEVLCRRIEQRAKQCEENGILYVFVVAPNKQSVYPEFLPDRYTLRRGQTRLDQLRDALRERRVVFLDPRQAFEEAKKIHDVYFKTDSHWNDYGAWIVYQQVLLNLPPELSGFPLPALSDYFITEQANAGEGDLARMAALKGLLDDKNLQLSPKTKPQAFPYSVRVLGDSFINPLLKYFPQNFEGRPRIIVDEVAERYLPSLLEDGFHDLQF